MQLQMFLNFDIFVTFHHGNEYTDTRNLLNLTDLPHVPVELMANIQ
jgi:hypothetical protein